MPESKQNINLYWVALLVVSVVLFIFYFQSTDWTSYLTCILCDKVDYLKLYHYFKNGDVEQIAFPFYTRPLVPFLAASIPIENVAWSFHIINLLFVILSVSALFVLWRKMGLDFYLMTIGFFWLICHWVGIIRYNVYDYVTVDVPLYLVQTLALTLFFTNRHKWFYLLAPIAILQKESFIAIMVVLIAIQIYSSGMSLGFAASKHLIFSLIIGVILHKLVIWLLPNQLDQRSSILAILYHVKLVIDDPLRLIRWFAAIGSAFGVFPVLVLFRFRWHTFQSKNMLALGVLVLMFFVFGLTAGEDMTRIMYLGFPFVMTLALIYMKNERWPVWIAVTGLSLPFMHLYPFSNHISDWNVDYASQSFVNQQAMFYLLMILIFGMIVFLSDRKLGRPERVDLNNTETR